MTRKRVCLSIAAAVCVAALLLLFLVYEGVLVFDHSGDYRGDVLYWNGAKYVYASGPYREGRTIAKTADGSRINEVAGDDTHTFVVVRSFLDDALMVREDYDVPTSGKITTAYWGHSEIADPAFFDAVAHILENAETDFEYTTDGIFMLKNGQKMRALYVGYEGCPVAACWLGYMGTVNGTWYITTEIGEQFDAGGAPKPSRVSCYTIPQEYVEILKKQP